MKSGVVLNKITRFWTKMTINFWPSDFVIQLIKLLQPKEENIPLSLLKYCKKMALEKWTVARKWPEKRGQWLKQSVQ